MRKDLVKSSKPKVILGDRFYSSYIATDYGDIDIDMVLKDDNGKPVKNCEIYFVHLDDIDTYNLEHNNANVHASGDYCIANTDSEGRVSTFTGLYCGRTISRYQMPLKKVMYSITIVIMTLSQKILCQS